MISRSKQSQIKRLENQKKRAINKSREFVNLQRRIDTLKNTGDKPKKIKASLY